MTANKMLQNGFYKLDLFQKPLPGFNVRGRSTIPSLAGVVCSISIMMLTFLYAGLKFTHLITKHNPNIATYVERNVIPPFEEFRFTDNGFFFAFGVEGYLNGLPRDDPQYVKMLLRLLGRFDGKDYEYILPFRKCQKEDFDKMPAPIASSAALLEKYKTDPNKSLNCIDWETVGPQLAIWGTQSSKDRY